MKLIPRRKKTPTTFEQVTGFVKLGVKGLVAQRLVRRGLKGYKFTRRAVPLAGLGALGLFLSKKLRGGDTPSTTSYTPPPAPAATSAYDKAEDGDTPTDDSLEVEAPNESTPPPPEKTKSKK